MIKRIKRIFKKKQRLNPALAYEDRILNLQIQLCEFQLGRRLTLLSEKE